MRNILISLVDLHYGGISNLVLNTSVALKEKYNVHVVYFGPNKDMLPRFMEHDVKICRIKYDGIKSLLGTSISLAKYIKRNNISVAFTNFTPDKIIVSSARVFAKFKIVGTIHNAKDRSKLPKRKTTVKGKFEEYFNNYIANHIICVSEASKNMAIKFKNLKNKDITVIHSGIKPLSTTTILRSKNDKIVFVTACRFVPIKGLTRLIETFKGLKAHRNDWELWLIGEGEEYDILIKQVRESNLNKEIKFLGYQPRLVNFYADAHFFINSSYHEALGISLIEALSTGMPLVGSNVGGIPEIIEHKVNGFLVDFEDREKTIESLIEAIKMNEEEYNALSKNCLDTYNSKFSMKNYISKYENLIMSLN